MRPSSEAPGQTAPLVHVGRQPIYDASGDIVAYELLFRDSAGATGASRRTALATSRVIVAAFTEFGLDQIAGDRACFINVTREFLVGELPVPFDADRAVLEIVESVEVDEDVVRGVRDLVEGGFAVALDHFAWDSPARRLLDLADYVKIDMLAVEPDEARETIAQVRRHGRTRLIAERLETEEQLRTAYALDFDLFQGHALGRPHVVSRAGLSPARLSRLRLVTELAAPDVDFDQVVGLVMRDPTLSYRLLHASNSAASGLRTRVGSVREAAVLLGLDTVRKWVVLMLFSDLTDATENELTATMTRARFCQLVADQRGLSGEVAFTVGLLSGVAELLGQPVPELAGELPLAEDVAGALTSGAGEQGRVLAAVRAYERGEVATATEIIDPGVTDPGVTDPGVIDADPARDGELLTRTYLSALGWSTRLVDALPPEEASRRPMPPR